MSEAPSSAASSAEASTRGVDLKKLEYLEQKYGQKASHVHLSSEEVNAMVDKVLRDSPTVQYLLQSLKLVRLVLLEAAAACARCICACLHPSQATAAACMCLYWPEVRRCAFHWQSSHQRTHGDAALSQCRGAAVPPGYLGMLLLIL